MRRGGTLGENLGYRKFVDRLDLKPQAVDIAVVA